MTFEVQVALQRLLIPAIGSLIGCYLLAKTDSGADWYDDEPVRGIAMATLWGAIFCAAGMIASDLWQRDLIAKPSEWSTWRATYRWEWMAWMIPASMVAFAVVRTFFAAPIHFTAMASNATGLIAVGIMFVCLNEGTAWEDQTAKILPWMAVSCAAILSNTCSLNSIARSEGARWVSLIVLAQLGCVAAISLQSYGSLGLWTLTGIGTTLGASVIGGVFGTSAKLHYGWQLSIVVVPLGIMAVACMAVSRFFYEAKPLPEWLIGSVVFLPTLVCIVDIVVGRVMQNWFRVLLAASVCCLILGSILTITKPWQSEW